MRYFHNEKITRAVVLFLILLGSIRLAFSEDSPAVKEYIKRYITANTCAFTFIRDKIGGNSKAFPLYPRPTRQDIERASPVIVQAILRAKAKLYNYSYKEYDDPWMSLSRAGHGNCGECTHFPRAGMMYLFGKQNVRIHQNSLPDLDFPLGQGHSFFSVRSYIADSEDEWLIVDPSISQWFRSPHDPLRLPADIRTRIPLVFIGTFGELQSLIDRNKKYLQQTWLRSKYVGIHEQTVLLYWMGNDGKEFKRMRLKMLIHPKVQTTLKDLKDGHIVMLNLEESHADRDVLRSLMATKTRVLFVQPVNRYLGVGTVIHFQADPRSIHLAIDGTVHVLTSPIIEIMLASKEINHSTIIQRHMDTSMEAFSEFFHKPDPDLHGFVIE